MIKDIIFGELCYDTMWQGKSSYFLYGKRFEIPIFIQGEESCLPTDLQRKAYQELVENQESWDDIIERKIYEFYQTVCVEYREMYGEDADLYAPIVDKPYELRGFVKPQSIMIPKLVDKAVINILFKTKWDLEMGIGMRFVDGKIDFVGVQSDVV